MAKINSSDDAAYVAGANHPDAKLFKPLPGDSGQGIGWTFEVRREGTYQYGWVLVDGRVSPALSHYRDDAEAYGRRVAAGI